MADEYDIEENNKNKIRSIEKIQNIEDDAAKLINETKTKSEIMLKEAKEKSIKSIDDTKEKLEYKKKEKIESLIKELEHNDKNIIKNAEKEAKKIRAMNLSKAKRDKIVKELLNNFFE